MTSPSSPALQPLHRLNRISPDFHDKLKDLLYGEEYVQCVPTLQGEDLVWLVDYLDKVPDTLDPSSLASRKCLVELKRICDGTRAILPASYIISSDLLTVEAEPFDYGGFGDVYHGIYSGSTVCIKRMRVGKEDLQTVTKIFCKEAVMWKRLTHPNVLPLLGVTITPPQLISGWMPGGDLSRYIKKHPGADRLGPLSDVAKGLHYLHSCNVVHGDLKGSNVLVDDSGRARIADFGLATVTQNLDSMRITSRQPCFSAQWTAPELLDGGKCNKGSDIFSFGMVMIEVFTGMVPFRGLSQIAAGVAITKGRRPPRPTHLTFTEGLWTLVQRCWDEDPRRRPEAEEVLKALLTPEVPIWKRLISRTIATHERISLIKTIFSDPNQVKTLGHLSGDDAQTFIDVIDEVLDSLPQDIRRKCLYCLYRICGRQALLPRSLKISVDYDPATSPVHQREFVNVWKGQYDHKEVAVRVLRVSFSGDSDQIKRRFCREAVGWKALCHPNVLPLLGVMMTGNQFAMISEWTVKGSINEFVKDNNVDRLELLRDATMGLIYMHDQGIIHGNLRGSNIFINNNGCACLTDFGLLTIISDESTMTSTAAGSSIVQWMSPELLVPDQFGLEESRPTKQSDCYALGMTIYEVLSGQVPFSQYSIFAITCRVLDGDRPTRPEGEQKAQFTDGIWEMLELCWKPQPGDRPNAEAILLDLGGNPFSL